MQVATDPCLTTDHYMLTNFSGTCNSNLSCHGSILSDLNIMCDLTQVVNFYSLTNDSRSHCCPVYCRIRTYLNVVFENYISDLWYFLVLTILIRRKTKTICPNYNTGMNDTISTYNTI